MDLGGAIARHGIEISGRADAVIRFAEPRRGFHGILFEFKSGDQDYKAALYQLKCYSAALGHEFPGPILVWGVTESGDVNAALGAIRQGFDQLNGVPREDMWLFSPAAAIPEIVELAFLLPAARHARAAEA